jgi:hypothetical protein
MLKLKKEQMDVSLVETDLGGKFGDPTNRFRYFTFKEGHFSDFKLSWNEKTYSVHRCILYSESKYFQKLFSSEWEGLSTGTVNFPERTVSDETIEVFFSFIYTNLMTTENLKQHLGELYILSDYFEVEKLKRFCQTHLEEYFTADTAKSFLPWVGSHSDPKVQEILSNYVAGNYRDLIESNFPFHKLGKALLSTLFQKMKNEDNYVFTTTGYSTLYLNLDHSLHQSIGDPSAHPQFEIFKNGHFSDFTLKCKRKTYSLHKYVLFAESLYFQTLLTSQWKESKSGEVKIPRNGISTKVFEVFLAFLYTGFINSNDLKHHLFELYDLADYFQVQSLKDLMIERCKQYLTDETAESFLDRILQRNAPELKRIICYYIAARFRELSDKGFSFHKVGKIMLKKILLRIVQILKSSPDIPHRYYPSNPEIGCVEEGEEEEVDEDIEDF